MILLNNNYLYEIKKVLVLVDERVRRKRNVYFHILYTNMMFEKSRSFFIDRARVNAIVLADVSIISHYPIFNMGSKSNFYNCLSNGNPKFDCAQTDRASCN